MLPPSGLHLVRLSIVPAHEACVGDLDQDIDEADAVTPMQRYLRRGSKTFPEDDAGGHRWACPLCPYVAVKPTVAQACGARSGHLLHLHNGQGLPGKREHHVDMRRLRRDKHAVWKCPWCNFGVPSAEAGKHSREILRKAATEHRLAKHPDRPRREWVQALCMKGRNAAYNHRIRITNLNQGVASSITKLDCARWHHYKRPLFLKRSGKDSFCLKKTWGCKQCKAYYDKVSSALKHKCRAKRSHSEFVKRALKAFQRDRTKAHKMLKQKDPSIACFAASDIDSIFNVAESFARASGPSP